MLSDQFPIPKEFMVLHWLRKSTEVTDAQTGKVITTLPIGDRCDGVAFDPAKKMIYSSNGEGTITVVQEVNANTFKVLETVQTMRQIDCS